MRSERGFTLIEVLVAMTLSTIIFGATMTVLNSLIGSNRRNAEHNEAQASARLSTDRLARELRNLASPTQLTSELSAQPRAIDRAEPYDFIFRVVGDKRPATGVADLNAGNAKRVRYCLAGGTGSDPGVLWSQTQTWTQPTAPPAPPASACPAPAGWNAGQDRVAVSSVVNRRGAVDRPLFLFNAPETDRITNVRTSLYLDPTPTRAPVETRLSTGVFLRNQNRQPVASFTATVTADGRLILNGSASDDPEGMALTYQWYLDAPSSLPDCAVIPTPSSCLGQGVVFEKSGLTGGGTHTVTLVVRDPARLAAQASQGGVQFPL